MHILFLCYWGINDGLTASTVIPHLNILSKLPEIKKVFFYTIERDLIKGKIELPTKVTHVALSSGKKYRDKFSDFTKFPSMIGKAASDHRIDFMFCRGTLAGALGYLVHIKNGLRYAVESYEPHSEYMVESGVWRRWGVRYNIQRFMEARQRRTASYLLPVAQAMKAHLVRQQVLHAKIFVMPCAVNSDMFSFDAKKRATLRESLGIAPDCVTGIYVGKFGGMYYDHEAFDIFKSAFRFFKKFRLIILSPDNAGDIGGKLSLKGISQDDYHVLKVEHHEVPAYLSTADLAFALYKPSPSKKFLSPVKIGEYWAMGLPVLIPEAIGDDSEIIRLNGAGATFCFPNLQPAFEAITVLLQADSVSRRKNIRELALRYRNFGLHEQVYKNIIHDLE